MRLLTLVPVYNEWPHLEEVLATLQRYRSDILVIDDGSQDGTYRELRQKGAPPCLRLPFNMGHWRALQTGFRYAILHGYDTAVAFDGDGQHLPGEIPKLVAALLRGEDVVIGESHARGGFARRICRRVLTKLSGLDVRDFTSGFRGYSRRAMTGLLDPAFAGLEYQDLGVLWLAREKGLRLCEVPVRMHARLGKSSRVFPGLPGILRYLVITLTFILVRKP